MLPTKRLDALCAAMVSNGADFNMECQHHRSWSAQTRQQANLERHQFLSSKRQIQQAFWVWLSCMYVRKHHAFIAKQIQLKSLEKRYRLMFASWNAGSVLEVWKLWHSLCRITSRTRRYKNLLMRHLALCSLHTSCRLEALVSHGFTKPSSETGST